MKKLVALFLVVAFFLFSTQAWAGGDAATEELFKEIKALKERVLELERKLGAQDEQLSTHKAELKEQGKHIDTHILHKKGVMEMFEAEGFRIGAGATFIGQGTPNANNAGGKEDSRFDGSYTVDIEIEKQFDDWGMAYILMEPGQGDGLDDDLSLFSVVNFDANDTSSNVFLSEVWYEQYLFDGQLTITGGKLYAPNYIDHNAYANDETTQFISRIFRNADTIEFPSSGWALGGRVNIAPEALNFLELEGLWMEADGDWEDVLDHPFIGTQLNFMPAKAFDYDEEMWGGNYRIYFFYNGSDHTELEDAEKTKERNYGFGLSCDQKITDTFGWFGRFGWQDPRTRTLEYHWSTGVQMNGKFWNRAEDIVAIAIGQAVPGKEYGDAGNPHDNETHLETYYAFKVNDHLTISPDFQIIWNPNGVGNENDGDEDTIFVYGVRGQVGF
jgi:carbohydrate-selective porin OprB